MDSELSRGHSSKFSTRGSNRILMVVEGHLWKPSRQESPIMRATKY